LTRHSIVARETNNNRVTGIDVEKFVSTVVLFHIRQDRRPIVKPETSGSCPSTPSSQQSSTDSTSKGIITTLCLVVRPTLL